MLHINDDSTSAFIFLQRLKSSLVQVVKLESNQKLLDDAGRQLMVDARALLSEIEVFIKLPRNWKCEVDDKGQIKEWLFRAENPKKELATTRHVLEKVLTFPINRFTALVQQYASEEEEPGEV